ncbi:MAG: hypothetical protein WBG19_07400 [Thermoplasmata archaeon]
MVDGAKACSACGRQVGMGQRAAGESVKVAKETGAAAEKVGKSLWGGVKTLGSKTKKEIEHLDGDKK